MSEFGSAEMKAVTATAERPKRGDAGLAADLETGHQEDELMREKQPQREGKDAQVLQDILRITEEMKVLQDVIADEERNVADQKKIDDNPNAPVADILKRSIVVRTEEIRSKRLGLPANAVNMDVDGLKAVLVGKEVMKAELESKLQTVTGSI